jgi:phospholipase/carboxylesterase
MADDANLPDGTPSSGPARPRCGRHGLAYDPSVHSGCVLCRTQQAPKTKATIWWPVLAVFVVTGLGIGGAWLLRSRETATDAASSNRVPLPPSELRTLTTRNAAGRSGVAFLPRQHSASPRPLLVLFHGTGGSGSAILGAFRDLAERRGVVVVAPDSGRSPDGVWNWQVGDAPGEVTADKRHATACIDEVLALPGVRIDSAYVLAAGHSGGASSAPYLASNDSRFGAFAVLHGGIFPGGLGANRVRGWFSTGASDTLRTPELVRQAALSSAAVTGPVTLRTFAGGHELSAAEMQDLMEWWLSG